MLEMLLDKKLLFVLMGLLTGLGVVDKCIVSMTMKRMVEAADMCGTAYRNRTCRCGTELSGIWHGRCCPADGCMWRRTWNPGMAVPSDNG